MKQTLLIRADASALIGSGHVMRCLALAQAWLGRGGSCIFVMAMDAGPILSRLQSEGIGVRRIGVEAGSEADAEATLEITRETGAKLLVLDGYHLSANYQRTIRQGIQSDASDVKILAVDDNCEQGHYYADFILNQNIHACEALYPPCKREPYTKLLLGLEYCLLRREFIERRRERRRILPAAHNILVTLGGSDSDNVTCRILDVLKSLRNASLDIKVVVGGNNRNYDKVSNLAQSISGNVEIIRDAQNMAKLMIWADLAISAAGSTVWEMCLLRLPCVLIVTAQNQVEMAERIKEKEIACGVYEAGHLEELGDELSFFLDSQKKRDDCSRRMWNLVNGAGPRRTLRMLICGELHLRPARETDAKLVWKWANDSTTRANSFSPDPIPWDDHLRWYAKKLVDSGTRIYMACAETGDGCALVRFDVKGGTAVAGITVAPEYRGLGLASEVIRSGTQQFHDEYGALPIFAYVKPNNLASRQAFEKGGYVLTGNTVYDGQECLRFSHEQ